MYIPTIHCQCIRIEENLHAIVIVKKALKLFRAYPVRCIELFVVTELICGFFGQLAAVVRQLRHQANGCCVAQIRVPCFDPAIHRQPAWCKHKPHACARTPQLLWSGGTCLPQTVGHGSTHRRAHFTRARQKPSRARFCGSPHLSTFA